jgi:cytochrome P450
MNTVVPDDVRVAAAVGAHRNGTYWWQHLLDAPVADVRNAEIPQPEHSPATRRSGLARYRDAAPAVHLTENGEYYVNRLDDVLAALRNPALSAYRQPLAVNGCPVQLLPISYEGVAHTRYRRILQPFFLPRPLAALPLRQHAADLIDAVLERGSCDFMTEIATPFAVTAMMELLGLPLDDLDKFSRLLDGYNTEKGKIDDNLLRSEPLTAYLIESFYGPRRPGILDALLNGDDPLTDDECLGFAAMMCAAGTGTVSGALGYGVWELARTPELVRLLRDDPDQIPAFADEVIRLESAVPYIPRLSMAPVEIAGVTIPAGSMVQLSVGGLNVIEDIDVTDGKIRRHRHWAFGAGPHRCLGALLARMEMTIMIEEWLRVPDFGLSPDYMPRVTWRMDSHQLDSLQLRWDT